MTPKNMYSSKFVSPAIKTLLVLGTGLFCLSNIWRLVVLSQQGCPTPSSVVVEHPELSCEQPVHDFGKLMLGKRGEHTFQLVNKLDEDLQIEKVNVGCSCAELADYSTVIPGKAEGKLTVAIPAEGAPGKRTSSIIVWTKSCDTQFVALKVLCDVIPSIESRPSRIMFGPRNEDFTVVEMTTLNESETVTIDSIEASTESLRIISEVIEAGSKFRLNIYHDSSEMPLGIRLEEINVSLNGSAQARLKIPVAITNPPDFTVKPEVLDFYLDAGREQPVSIELISQDAATPKVEKAMLSDQRIQFKAEAEFGNAQKITIEKFVITNELNRRHLSFHTGSGILAVPIRVHAQKPFVYQSAPASKLIGQSIDIQGPILRGGRTNVADYRGKPVIVAFWASWCGYCRKELPNLVELYREYHEHGLEIVGVNTDLEKDKATTACELFDLPWPNIHFPSEGSEEFVDPLSLKYNVRGIPALFLLDDSGVVVSNARGEKLKQHLRELFNNSQTNDADL